MFMPMPFDELPSRHSLPANRLPIFQRVDRIAARIEMHSATKPAQNSGKAARLFRSDEAQNRRDFGGDLITRERRMLPGRRVTTRS
jgi:hypothetical protein